ncbi:MAG: sigma-54-dependent Fis family transcriptional regulator [Desulfobacteraceae bacterium 4572_187]|nr:MAG: sigma-54-dependent Fis family transcriptional regulator [Desulfobacteraceae bacterium 4572_187]
MNNDLQKISPIIGVSPNIVKTKELINHVADTGLNIIICGESGVGKEVVAQNLYQKSPRKGKPFIKINCAALPEGLLESELFGFEQGAFTGAERRRRGKFEMAHGGVLLLDEIGDMSISLQAKLLHVLQSGEFSRLGSEKELKTDTWILAATNHELEQDIKNDKFREDLYYRLNIIKIYISPLRERPEDIPVLIDHYLKKYSPRFKNSGVKPDYSLFEKLQKYNWPGNVRELQNVLKRILVMGNWEEIVDELTHNSYATNNSTATETSSKEPSIVSDILNSAGGSPPDLGLFSLKDIKRRTLDKVEKEAISYVLGRTDWNRSKAAKILKISYKTLLYKISDLNIERPPKF